MMLLRSIRRLSTKPPHLSTPLTMTSTHSSVINEELDEFNDFYTDVFTQVNKEDIGTTNLLEDGMNDEINELNREMADLYGVDVNTDPSMEQPIEQPLEQPIEPIIKQKQINNNIPKKESSTILQKLESGNPLIITSSSNSPIFNLALENKIFELAPRPIINDLNTNLNTTAHRLVFYINTPAVIIGKNQNPYKETSVPLLSSLGIPMLRRFSGGGTVVHDLGNLNYSFMTSREEFQRALFNGAIVNVVNQYLNEKEAQISLDQSTISDKDKEIFGQRLQVNERGDIVLLYPHDTTEYKVSGSAYRISKGKAYHHGTMLLDSNLTMLGSLLKRQVEIKDLKDSSVESVRSKVRNVKMDKEIFMDLIKDAFKKLVDSKSEVVNNDDNVGDLDGFEILNQSSSNKSLNQINEIESLELNESHIEELQLSSTIEKLKSWDWNIGSTPNFEVTYEYTPKNSKKNQSSVSITFEVKKSGILSSFTADPSISHHFDLLQMGLDSGEKILFKGDIISGFIMDEDLSCSIAEVIDGTEV